MESLGAVHLAILAGAVFVLIGIVSSLVANRFGAPLLFVFLCVGMLIGQDGLGIAFDDYQLTYFIGSLALSVILFDGGLRTRLAAVRSALAPSIILATVGVVLTAVLTAIVAGLVLDLTVIEALLLGGIVASTDAAAVFFLLRAGGLRLQPRVGSVLEIESGTNDPMAVLITLVLTELLLAQGSAVSAGAVVAVLLQQAVLGAVLGVLGGLLAAMALNRIAMPGGLHPLFAVVSAVFIYGLTSSLGGSGFLAAYLAGLVLANRPVRAYPSILAFHDAATWLFQIVMFLVLGLLVTPTTLVQYAWPGLAVALFLTLVARPAAVWLCLLPFGFAHREKLFMSWVGLRGAVSIFLATIPMLSGVPNAEAYFNIAFFVVLTSLLLQGGTITKVARWTGTALRRTAPVVRRIEVDIPGQTEQELVGYPIAPESVILALRRLPRWARLALVVREGEVMNSADAGGVKAGDYAYFLVPANRVMRFDRLFATSPVTSRRLGPVLGELAINGDAGIAEIAALYDLDATTEGLDVSVSEFFAQYLKEPPQPGQRLPLGRAWLVARVVEDGRVTRAGLQIEELIGNWLTSFRPRRAARNFLHPKGFRRLLRRRRSRARAADKKMGAEAP